QWENGGYFVLRQGIFDNLREGEDMVPHAFRRLIAANRLLAQRHTGFWRAADTFKDRVGLEELYHARNAPWVVWGPQRFERAPRQAPVTSSVSSVDEPIALTDVALAG